MSRVLNFTDGAATNDGTKSTDVLLTDQPDTRISILGFAYPVIAIGLTLALLYVPLVDVVRVGLGLTALALAVVLPAILIREYVRLKLSRYRVADTHIESHTGIYERTERRIPLAYIREVTIKQTFFQSLFGTSNIRVFATNGDSIELENVKDGERKREIIWRLVLANSPGRSQHLSQL